MTIRAKAKLSKFKFNKQTILIATAGLFVVMVIFLIREIYLYNHPMERKSNYFQAYMPTVLPKGVTVKKVAISLRMESRYYPLLTQ